MRIDGGFIGSCLIDVEVDGTAPLIGFGPALAIGGGKRGVVCGCCIDCGCDIWLDCV